MDTPDLAGFRIAQQDLVNNLGMDVTFNFDPSLGYGSGVYLDPESGEPLDPTITPSASVTASASFTLKATVIRRVPQLTRAGQNDGNATVGGIIPTGKVWLRVPAGTYPDPEIFSATSITIDGETFTIDRFVKDGIGQIDRLYVECEMISDDLT